MPKPTFKGNTVAEYGLIFGLLVIVSLAAVGNMGGSISQLLFGAGNATSGKVKPVSSSKLMSLVASQPSSASGASTSGGANSGGLPSVMTNASISGASNTTSVSNKTMTAQGTTDTAKYLEKLAEKTSDPASKAYLNKMSNTVFLMAGLQGELDGLAGLESDLISNQQALTELVDMQASLEEMLKNPPANISKKLLKKAIEEGNKAQTIGNAYLTSLSRFFDAEGNVIADFRLENPENKPGKSVAEGGQVQMIASTATNPNAKYSDTMPMEVLKERAKTVLNSNDVAATPVKQTVQTAVTVESTTEHDLPEVDIAAAPPPITKPVVKSSSKKGPSASR